MDSEQPPKSEQQDQHEGRTLGVYDRVAFLKKFGDLIKEIPNLPTANQMPQLGNESGRQPAQGSLARKLQVIAQNRENFRTESSEMYQAQLHEVKKEVGRSKHQFNVFAVQRGPCKVCSSKDVKCDQYRACFNVESFRGVELFQCLNCKCAMNSHVIVRSEFSFSNLVCQQVNRRYVLDTHLSFKASLALFFVDRENALEFKIDVESLVSSLNEGGFNVLSFYEMDLATLQQKWIEKFLYSKKSRKLQHRFQRFQNYQSIFNEIVKLYSVENTFNLRDSIRNPEEIEILDYYLDRLQKVNKKFKAPYEHDQIVLAFLVTSNSITLHTDLKKFFYAAKTQLPPDLVFFYSSKDRMKAFRDCCLFFPSFFSANVISLLVTQQIDGVHTEKRQINDSFLDLLDFNNITVIKHDFQLFGMRQIQEAFDFMPNVGNFLKLINPEGVGMLLKIGCKVGPTSITSMSSNLPNYYKIQSPIHNQRICDKLCPELFTNYRILVIYRPLVVKSNLSQLLGEIWRINGFNMIAAADLKVGLEEAKMLATLEDIHSANLDNYITMMTEGFCQIVLYSRPGAFQYARLLSEGCLTGLRVKQSKKLKELSIMHQSKSGQHFVEKLPMHFNNNFELFNQQNIFSSIKEIFDLEELVLQENQHKYNRNVFINSDSHDSQLNAALMVTQQKSQTTLTQQLRSQIIKDLPKENFNFYLYTTPDELTTEQLTSLFLPECVQNEVVYVVIKPSKEEETAPYFEAITTLLQKMRFTIFDKKLMHLDGGQAQEFINLITPFKQVHTDQLAQFYSQELMFLMLMKPAGQQEMRNFNAPSFTLNPVPGTPQLIHHLPPYLLPCLNIQAIRFAQKQFSPHLQKFDAAIFGDIKQTQTVAYLLKYILSFCMGLSMMSNDFERMEQESTMENSHFRVRSVTHCDFEIRVRRNERLKSKYQVTYLSVLHEYDLLSWYYAKVNKLFPQRCPLSYQFRILYPEKIEAGEIDQVFDCQEFVGRNFLLEIYRQIYDFGNSVYEKLKTTKLEFIDQKNKGNEYIQKAELRKYETQMNKVAQYMERRGKMLAYYWGVKLAKFVKELELIEPKEFPNGYGKIIRKPAGYECEMKLKTMEYEHISFKEKENYEKVMQLIFKYIHEQIENDPTFYDDINQMQSSMFQQSQLLAQSQFESKREGKTHVEKQILKYFNAIFPNDQPSELYKYALNNLNLIPQQIQLHHLRVQHDREQIKVQFFDGERTFFDWAHETREAKLAKEAQINATSKQPRQPYSNFVLSHCLPQVRSKFQLVAEVLYLLHVELRLFKFADKYIDTKVLEEDVVFSQIKSSIYSPKGKAMMSSMKYLQQKEYRDWFHESFSVDRVATLEHLIKGFESSYFLEEETIIEIQRIHKTQVLSKKQKMPDIRRMFLFLKCIDELEKYIGLQKSCNERIAELIKIVTNPGRFQGEKVMEISKADEQLIGQEIDQKKEERNKYQGYVKIILNFLAGEQFSKAYYFDSEQTELRFNQTKVKESRFNTDYYTEYMQNNLVSMDDEDREADIADHLEEFFQKKKELAQQKEFIESKRYFQPLEMGNNKTEWGKLDQEQIDEKVEEVQEQRTRKVVRYLDDYQEAPYMKEMQKDDIQRKWLEEGIRDTAQGRFVDTRPDNKKTGIYVDSTNSIDKQLDDKIDKVIKKFMQDKINNFGKK